MILITGGAYQGLKEFARSLVTNGNMIDAATASMEEMKEADIITDLHLYIRKILEEKKDAKEEVGNLLEACPKIIVTVAELGCGIVPMDAFERKYRETVGRISCEIAKKADAVYRVNCGIGLRIK